MNETNRTAIILLAAAWIVLMAVVIFAAWAADVDTIERLDDFVQYLDDHRTNASRLILTLGALVLIVLALLLIIVELAPEEETREIRVEQAGASNPVRHMAQTKANRRGSVGSLNFSSRSSFPSRLRWGRMSRPCSANLATSPCSWEMTTAMSVSSIKATLASSGSRSVSGAVANRAFSSLSASCQ